MKLEAGKWYRTRKNKKAFVAFVYEKNEIDDEYVAIGHLDNELCTWMINGWWSEKDEEYDKDIIVEWDEPEAEKPKYQKWEYLIWEDPDKTRLDELGSLGWELIVVNGCRHLFKRPVMED